MQCESHIFAFAIYAITTYRTFVYTQTVTYSRPNNRYICNLYSLRLCILSQRKILFHLSYCLHFRCL